MTTMIHHSGCAFGRQLPAAMRGPGIRTPDCDYRFLVISEVRLTARTTDIVGPPSQDVPISDLRMPLKIEIGGQHNDVANCHAARPRQHERHHARHFARLQQTSRLPGFLQLLGRPVREQGADDGSG